MQEIESINRCCQNIAERESEIRAFVEETLDLDRIREQADALLNHYPDVAERPPLFGVLVGVKDIVHVDGFATACGSSLPVELLTGAEAPMVARLKRAGAIIAGKTITAEFACSDPGPTRNPCNLEYSPGGSSSGSVAGVAADFFDLGIGSQTGGSTVRPAAYCGVLGFKPSLGRLDSEGFFHYSKSMDHPGLFARDVSMLESAMQVLVDDWRPDAVCAQPRFAIPQGPYLEIPGEAARRQFFEVIEYLRQYGLHIESHDVLDDIQRQNEDLDRLTAAEIYRVHAQWLEQYGDRYGPKLREVLAQGAEVGDTELEALRATARHKQEEMRDCMRDLGVDYWLSPAATDVAPQGLEWTGDHRMNSIWTYTGLPAISLPSGVNHAGLPYGLQLVGRYRLDEELLATAKSLQRMLPDQSRVSD